MKNVCDIGEIKMWLKFLFIAFSLSGLDAILYDSYLGKPASTCQIEIYTERNNTQYCLIDVKQCEKDEWRRVDGSCTNPKCASSGMVRTPSRKLLPLVFSKNYGARKTVNGKNMPLARVVRKGILEDGKISDINTTQLLSYFLLFKLNDLNNLRDVFNYLSNTTNCCEPEGKSNYICAPVEIPPNDPVRQFSGVRCQNLTKPQSFQYYGCADFGTTEFARVVTVTPLLDLGTVYGIQLNDIDKIRTYHKGLLKSEIDHGKEFPPSNPSIDPLVNKCYLNVLPHETRCHLYITDAAIGSGIVAILFYRQHNNIAKQLAEMNPCWDDDRLFNIARDINIAVYQHIIYCELMPIILGEENVIVEDICQPEGYRDLYDESICPQLTDEYVYANRWFHNIQEVDLKLYDDDGNYLNTINMLDLSSRTGFLPIDNNINKLYQGSFRQPGAKADSTIDPGMGENVLRGLQFASDVATNDIEKGRLSGFAPYVKYREFCSGKSYKTFESLNDVMTEERIYRLTELYQDVLDIDLMAGILAESVIPGTMVTPTVYCLMVEHLKKAIAFDQHWFERPNRPHAFNEDQLNAVKSSKMAGVMCANADGVTKIQPNAFRTISPGNPLAECSSDEIGKIDLSPWKDETC